MKQSEFPIEYMRKKQLDELLGKLQKAITELLPGNSHVLLQTMRADYGEFVKVRVTLVEEE